MLHGGLLVAGHVVFAEVAAGFHGDERHGQAAGVFEAMWLAKGDVDGLAFAGQAGVGPERDPGGAFDHDPVSGAVQVGLQRGGRAGIEPQGADAEARAFSEDGNREGGLCPGEGHRRLGEARGVRSVHAGVPLSHPDRLAAKW